MIPHEGGHCQLSFLPANPSSVPHTLAGLFEIQRHSQMRRSGRASPWTHSKSTDANLDCVSIKTQTFYTVP